jgi:hypothetical protein
MIKKFVERWENNKPAIRAVFEAAHPICYKDVVKTVIQNITSEKYGDFCPDPERIHQINDCHSQGTLVFVIGEKGYQPSNYYYCKVSYGSCSGCDTLESIRLYNTDRPTKQQVDQYMMLALHIVQWLKPMEDSIWSCDLVNEGQP